MSGQSKPWLYSIIDDKGRFYRLNMGMVMPKSDVRPLIYSPSGWQEASIVWKRDIEKWGVVRNFTFPLTFVLDGAEIIRYLKYIGNFEKKVYLLLQKQYLFIDSTHFYYYYDLFYKGKLALTTAEDGEDGVKIDVIEGGLTQDMEANENTEYEIPVDEITVRMDGIVLQANSQFVTVQDGGAATTLSYQLNWLQMSFVTNEGTVFDTTQESTLPLTTYISSSPKDDNRFLTNFFFASDATLVLNFTATFNVKLFNGGYLELYVKNSNGTRTQLFKLQGSNSAFPETLTQTYVINSNINIAPGEKLYLIAEVSKNLLSPSGSGYEITPSEINISYQSRKAPTFIKALFPLTLYKRLLAKISPSASVISTLLIAYANFAVTSGDAIRGLPGAKIKINFNDFYKSINALLCTCLQIQGNEISLEIIAGAFLESNVIPLGEVKEIKTKTYTEVICNTVKFGYAPQTYDDVNGRFEFNNTSTYSSDIKEVVNELDRTSPIRGDSYGAEFQRINLAGKKTTDSSEDNDNWFLDIDIDHPQSDVEHGTYYNLFRDTYDTFTGAPASVFNVRLSPARMVSRQKPYINSIFYGFEGTKLVFQTTDKNRLLYTKKGSEIYDEDADIIITPQDRLFKPEVFDMIPQSPARITEQLMTNPNRCFSFVHHNGLTYRGFNIDIGIAADSKESQNYLLLSAPGNDLTTLV